LIQLSALQPATSTPFTILFNLKKEQNMNKSMYFFLSVLVAGFVLWTAFQETTREDQDHQIEVAVAENVQLFIQEKTLACEEKAHQEATTRAMAKLAEMGKPMPAPAPRPARPAPATTDETKPATEAEKVEEKEPVRTRTGTTRETTQEGERTRTGTTRIEEEKKEGEEPKRTRTGAGGGGR
jgi:hypothetical protein